MNDGRPVVRATAYGWSVVLILTAANSLAFVDRQILALLVEPIKADLGVSDTGISLLYGFGFSLFYVLVGLPMARLADQSDRRTIIAMSILVWSLMTMVGGLARSFTLLFLARIGVGVGEAGLTPSAQSILADYFPRDRLPLANGIYATGIYIGSGLALVVGGLVITALERTGSMNLPVLGLLRPWQVAFLIVGAPGLLLGLIAFTIREPVRTGVVDGSGSAPLARIGRHVGTLRWSYIGLILGLSLMVLVGQGTSAWIPALFERKFGWTSSDIGLNYGLIVFCCGTSGTLAGGVAAGALRRRGLERANLWAACAGFAALVPLTILFPLMPTGASTLAMIGIMNFFAGFPFGGGFAALQEITPNRMRGQITAAYMLGVNLIGAGLGPTLVALATDRLFRDPAALPRALSLVAAVVSPLALLFILIALVHHGRALRHMDHIRQETRIA